MIKIKTKEEIDIMREGGKRLSFILGELVKEIKEGVKTGELDEVTNKLITEQEGKPAFLNYRPETKSQPYPASVCVSINDEIVHGLPDEDRVIKKGDIVTVDLGFVYKGLITDMAYTVSVGEADEKTKKLLSANEKALYEGIKEIKDGNHIGDIGNAIEEVAKKDGFAVYRELVGHGVGHKLHEEPHIPNFGNKGTGEEMKEGMIFAIEPMFGEGEEKIELGEDGFTYKTKDGSRSAHFEHTVVVTQKGSETLTKFPK